MEVKVAVLFDMNGVLVDDEALHERAFRSVIEQYGLKLSRVDYRRYFAGKTDDAGFSDYLAQCAPRLLPSLGKLMAQKSAAYRELAHHSLTAYKEAVVLVRRLERAGHQLGLVTGALHSEVELILEQLGLADTFAAIVAAGDTERGKPFPDPFLLAAERLHRPPRECVVIEDSPAGVAAARAAGMHCIAVTSTHSRPELQKASHVVGTLEDVGADDLLGFVNV
jgi:HAD superfamily hydrolase (TIGR01509 family)